MKRHSKLPAGIGWIMILCMLMGTLGGCGSSVAETETERETTVYESELAEARSAMDQVMDTDASETMDFTFSYDPSQCIWVDDEYRNMTLEKAALEVSDEDVDYNVQSFCEQYAEETTVTDRAAQAGDTVVLDFDGTVDGKVICKETGYDLELGNGDINKKFEKAIIGANTDDVVKTKIKYSKDNDDENLAGKTVKYTIRIRQIKEVTIPELTDSLVSEHTDYETVEEYKAFVKENLQKEYRMDAIDGWLSENSYLIAIPSSLKEKYQKELVAYYSYVAEYYEDTDLETVLEEAGYASEEEMLADNEDAIQDSVQKELIYAYIVQAENLSSTMGDYQEYLKQQAALKGCTETGELLILYSEDDLRFQFMESVADNWIYDRCTFK